jgi:hypothetical protein
MAHDVAGIEAPCSGAVKGNYLEGIAACEGSEMASFLRTCDASELLLAFTSPC